MPVQVKLQEAPVASVVAGLLWDHVGHSTVFLYGAAFAVIGSIALLALVPAEQIARPDISGHES